MAHNKVGDPFGNICSSVLTCPRDCHCASLVALLVVDFQEYLQWPAQHQRFFHLWLLLESGMPTSAPWPTELPHLSPPSHGEVNTPLQAGYYLYCPHIHNYVWSLYMVLTHKYLKFLTMPEIFLRRAWNYCFIFLVDKIRTQKLACYQSYPINE